MFTTSATIQNVCKIKGWSIAKLARQTELNSQYIKELFAEAVKPTLEVINKIATAIGVPAATLMKEDIKTKKNIITLHLSQAGMEQKAKEKLEVMFGRLFSDIEKEEMGLEILNIEREVSFINKNGKQFKKKENLIPGYIVIRIKKMIDYERFHCCLKNEYVRGILQGEMEEQQLNHVLEACGKPVMQIEEPPVPVVEKTYRSLNKVLKKVQKGTMHLAEETKQKLQTAIDQLLEQKRRYATYLRNISLLNCYRVQKNKTAVFEFPLEIYRKARSRLDRLLDDGWDANTVLAIRLAKEARNTPV